MNENLCRLVAEHLNTEASKQERATLAQRLITVLGVLCFIVLVGVATNAYAQEIPLRVFEDQTVSLQLFAAPCENEESRKVVAGAPRFGLDARKLMKAGSVWNVGTPYGVIAVPYAGCWAEYTYQGKKGYAVSFEDGQLLFFPEEVFKLKDQRGA